MKVIALNGFGDSSRFYLEQMPLPEPGPSQVRIRIKAAGFNPVDFKMRRGDYASSNSIFPLVIGADCSGVIDAVGKEVHDLSIGEEVYAFIFGPASNGTYAEYICVPSSFVVKKPRCLSFEQAAGFPLVGLTAYRSVIETGAVRKNASILVIGASGGVGSIAVQLARYLQVGSILATAGSQDSIDYLVQHLSLKKEKILLYPALNEQEMQKKLLEMNENHPVDVILDFVGGPMRPFAFDLLAAQGHFVTILPEKEGITPKLSQTLFQKSLSLHSVFVGSEAFSNDPKAWQIYKRELLHLSLLIEEGKIQIPKPTIFTGLSVENVQKAHALLESGHVKGKLVMIV